MKSSEEAYQSFLALKAEAVNYNLDFQSESDTRAKIISRILHDTLDWPQQNVKREEHANPGFMDYLLFTSKPIAVIEAKKSGDTFELPADIAGKKHFTLGGILRTVKNLSAHVDQVCQYCWRNGVEYAIISNGLQWVAFKAFTDGIHIGQGRVIIFNGFDDIASRFAEFWNLFAKIQVENNSLVRAFQPSDVSAFQYKRVNDHLRSRKERVSRNTLSADIESLIPEYLGEIASEDSDEKLKKLFVKSRALDEMLRTVEHRLSLSLSSTLTASGSVVENAAMPGIRDGIKKRVQKHVALPPRGDVLVLLGRVGSGKTTFLNHFLKIDLKALLHPHIVVSFDFRLLEPGSNVSRFFYGHLEQALAKNKTYTAQSTSNIRKIYAPEIRQMTAGALSVLQKQNQRKYEETIAEFLLRKIEDSQNHLLRTLKYLADKTGVRSVFLFDNVDQLDFKLQQELFTFAHSVSSACHALSIMPMWEETFFRSSRTGVLSTYHMTAYTLPPTSVVDVISRRLEVIVEEIIKGGLARSLLTHEENAPAVAEFLSLVRNSILHDSRRARFFLEAIAMGNLRRAMQMFETFLKSGHTDAGKMLHAVRTTSTYLIPMHEFVKSIGLGDERYYQGDISYITNLFAISDETRPSHFTKPRILQYLLFQRNRTTSFGKGFIASEYLKTELFRIGTSESDLSESLKTLSAYALVENDVYDATAIGDAYRITPAGRYYMQHLSGRFAYLDLVLQDTPIADPNVVGRIWGLMLSTDLEDRFQRVEAFLQYLAEEEEREHRAIIHTTLSIPLRTRVVQAITLEYMSDREYIRRRVAGRRPSPMKTPYTASGADRTTESPVGSADDQLSLGDE